MTPYILNKKKIYSLIFILSRYLLHLTIIIFNVKRSWIVPKDLKMVPMQKPLGITTVVVETFVVLLNRTTGDVK